MEWGRGEEGRGGEGMGGEGRGGEGRDGADGIYAVAAICALSKVNPLNRTYTTNNKIKVL